MLQHQMQNSQQNGGFSFGQVADTEYVSYQIIDTENKLPYHPFHFDLTLTVFKNKPPYEQIGTQFPLSRQKTVVFGRKKKNSQQSSDDKSIAKYLNAEIISGKHFSINEQYVIKDMGSKNGTFIWVDRQHPRKIQPNDVYLIAKQPLVMNRVIHLPKSTIDMTYNDKTIKINDQKKLFLIGSHQKCDLIVPSLYHFQVCINITNFTIFTHLEEQQADLQHGLWYKLRTDKKEDVVLEHGNLLLVDPYIFRVTS